MTSKRLRDCTEVKTECFTYEWQIKNFKCLNHENEKNLQSSIFTVGDDEVKWCLEMYPRGKLPGDRNFVSINLCLISPGTASSDINVDVEISIIESQNTVVKHKFTNVYNEASDNHGKLRFVGRDKLIKACGSSNSFTIRCKIERLLEIVTKRAKREMSFNLKDHQLVEDCRRLINDPDDLADVIIIVGEEKFPAHKVLLATRSQVFAAMFRHKQLKENCTNEVRIEDLDSEVVKGMLEFIYSDEVTNLPELCCRLITAAHKYELKRLKALCENAMHEILDVDNAVEILTLAEFYGSKELAKHVIAFISDHLSDVTETKAYQEIDNPKVLRKLLRLVAQEKK